MVELGDAFTKETTMKPQKTLAEYAEFAKSKGRKIEDGGNVAFGKDGDVAIKFETEAHEAGFNVTRTPADNPNFYHGTDKIAGPKIWFVRLDQPKPPQ